MQQSFRWFVENHDREVMETISNDLPVGSHRRGHEDVPVWSRFGMYYISEGQTIKKVQPDVVTLHESPPTFQSGRERRR